jgi:hypothetical protein
MDDLSMDNFTDQTTSPTITSFILRFIQEESALRGTVRCIQNDQEITFTRWEDAVAFISRFVPLKNNRKED